MNNYQGLEKPLGDLYSILLSTRESIICDCSFLDIANNLVARIYSIEDLMQYKPNDSALVNRRQNNIDSLKKYLALLRDFPEFAKKEATIQAEYNSLEGYIEEQYWILRGKSSF
jgi:hypothetical protein